jgi:hypothetical protein
MIRPQSVAEHSFRVAALTTMLCQKLELSNYQTQEATFRALYHDQDEVHSGDIPTPFKHANHMKETPIGLDPLGLLIKVADLTETILWVEKWGLPTQRRYQIITGIARALHEAKMSALGAYPKFTLAYIEMTNELRLEE